jgi:hypothetical protein
MSKIKDMRLVPGMPVEVFISTKREQQRRIW